MKKFGMKHLGAALVLALTLVACGGGGVNSDYRQPWYNVYGQECGRGQPKPGCNFWADGAKIGDTEDPDYAYNYHSNYYTDYSYKNSYGENRTYTGYLFVSGATGVIYDDQGFALNSRTRDTGLNGNWDEVVAKAQATVARQAGTAFATSAGLTADKGVMIAEALSAWATANKAGYPESDLQAIDRQLWGFDLKTVQVDFHRAQNGDFAALNARAATVAQHWGTSVGTVKAVVAGRWLKKTAASLGL